MMISVIIPIYNAEPWLRRCLDSCEAIVSDDIEFIMVNDHSKDNSRDIALEYVKRDSHFQLVDNDVYSKGVSSARNKGIDLATGEWITFLDADDYLDKDAHSAFIRSILSVRAHSDANIIQLDHKRWFTEKNIMKLKWRNPTGIYTPLNLPQAWVFCWNKLFRRDFILDNNIRFSYGMQFGEDTLFVMDCLTHDKRIACSGEIAVVHCFDNKESLSHSKTAKLLVDQAKIYTDFLMKQEDPEIREMVRALIAGMWDSKSFKQIFGPDGKDVSKCQ